jgi:2-polyprenyl-3-methyl-5-hydroxy-6-metoxy-1,4-benzoquinol methylase
VFFAGQSDIILSPQGTIAPNPTVTNQTKQSEREFAPVHWLYRKLRFLVDSPSAGRAKWSSLASHFSGPPDRGAEDSRWENPFSTLRKKWTEVPDDVDRVRAPHLLEMGDKELLAYWEDARKTAVTGEHFSRRGWYHMLYEPLFRGARMIDFGSGLGMDGLSFASHAAHVTMMDLAKENLALLKRIADLKGLANVEFVHLENFESFQALGTEYDVILASGSLHHAPQHVIRREIQELAPRLKVGGRWLQLAYPKERWEREGRPPFSKWGECTDGAGTPWGEWYDLQKLLKVFEPMKFEALLAFNYHNNDFNWFDLVRIS